MSIGINKVRMTIEVEMDDYQRDQLEISKIRKC